MTSISRALCLAALGLAVSFAAELPQSVISKTLDGQLKMVEGELIPLVEAMPADKFDFAPKEGEFKGVRSFRQQAMHIGAVIYIVSAPVLGDAKPAQAGEGENGPASVTSKAEVVQYLKDAFAYAHRAMNAITDANATELVASPFGGRKVPRIYVATMPVWHTFDHYGQMCVYARMNGIVPPASRK